MPETDLRVSPSLVIHVSAGAIAVRFVDPVAKMDLGLGDLILIELVAAEELPLERCVALAAEQSGDSSVALTLAARRLRERGLVCAGVTPRTGEREQAEERSRPGPTSALVPTDVALHLSAPFQLVPTPRGLALLDHGGDVITTFSARQVVALQAFDPPCDLAEADARQRSRLGARALARHALVELAGRACHGGLIAPPTAGWRAREDARHRSRSAEVALEHLLDEVTDEHRAAESAHRSRTGRPLVPVVPVNTNASLAPLSLGMVVANAIAYDGGRLGEHYSFRRTWVTSRERLERTARDGPAVFLFSDYVLNVGENLELSAAVKELSPASLCVHGGPDVPKYDDDLRSFHSQNPHIDVAVHGEGEDTLAELLAAPLPAWERGVSTGSLGSLLDDVAGLSWWDAGEVVRTGTRTRRADLDGLPSPYLTGLFDEFAEVCFDSFPIETNRGCPYGCTFCDWGSATRSSVRCFSLERVLAEIDWAVSYDAATVALTDANVGMFDRDLEIVDRLCAQRVETGSPRMLGYNYAKDRSDHHHVIIGKLAAAGIEVEGLIPLQTVDTEVLRAANRTSITLAEVDGMTRAFRDAGLPLYTTMLYGLPGSTEAGFHHDLQVAIDREILAKVAATEVIMNSPLNSPGERRRFEIVDPPGEPVRSSSTFTRPEWERMDRLRTVYLFAERRGLLRELPRYVRHETGMPEIELLDRLAGAGWLEAVRYPNLALVLRHAPAGVWPPGCWARFVDEVVDLAVGESGVAHDRALETVREVQLAVLPAPRRSLPAVLDLAHDYAAWHGCVLEAKYERPDTWPSLVAPLRSFGPGSFRVDDDFERGAVVLGEALYSLIDEYPWELESPVQRPVAIGRWSDMRQPTPVAAANARPSGT